MSEPVPDWLAAAPMRLRPALMRCAAGDLPPNVALMQLLGEAADQNEAERALAAAIASLEQRGESGPAERLAQALALWRADPGAWETVKSVLTLADHQIRSPGGEEAVAHWAALFDRLAERSPEAAVALYSLGRRDILEAATAELVQLVRSWEVLGLDKRVLDLGCGIGRLSAALAPEVEAVVGIDVSHGMVDEARRRCAGLANVSFMQTSGRDLAAFGDESFDLVLAVDVFPYLVASRLAAHHVGEAARVLRPGGSLLVFNFSYPGDIAADRAELACLTRPAGLEMLRSGTRDLSLWDGTAFRLFKRAPGATEKIEVCGTSP